MMANCIPGRSVTFAGREQRATVRDMHTAKSRSQPCTSCGEQFTWRTIPSETCWRCRERAARKEHKSARKSVLEAVDLLPDDPAELEKIARSATAWGHCGTIPECPGCGATTGHDPACPTLHRPRPKPAPMELALSSGPQCTRCHQPIQDDAPVCGRCLRASAHDGAAMAAAQAPKRERTIRRSASFYDGLTERLGLLQMGNAATAAIASEANRRRSPRKGMPPEALAAAIAARRRIFEERLAGGKKTCPVCGRTLDLAEFPLARRQPDGHHGWCRRCKAEDARERYNRMRAPPAPHRVLSGWVTRCCGGVLVIDDSGEAGWRIIHNRECRQGWQPGGRSAAWLGIRCCERCGKTFMPVQRHQRYCTRQCMTDARNQRQRERCLWARETAAARV
jgi:hypothetical protein